MRGALGRVEVQPMTESTRERIHRRSQAASSRGRSRKRLAFALAGVGIAVLIAWAAWSWVTRPVWDHTPLAAGDRVDLANGLSIKVPSEPGVDAVRQTWRWRLPWLYDSDGRLYDEYLGVIRHGESEQPSVFLASFSGDPRRSYLVDSITDGRGMPPLAYSAPDGRAEVYWRAGEPDVFITTAIPGKQAGLVDVAPPSDVGAVPPSTARDVNRVLRRVWRDLSVEGMPVPQVPES